MKHIQNNQNSISAYKDFKIFFKNLRAKSLETFANVCDFQKENRTLGYEFKNL
jgi:hypothetical protein